MKKIFLYLFNGFSDWEIAFLTPEIKKNNEFNLIYFSTDGQPVESMGGLVVSPHISLEKVVTQEVDMLILPGGTAWEKDENKEITDLTLSIRKEGKPIAAICAATMYLGQLGILNEIKHTSNDLNYLKGIAPNYKGEGHYQNKLAVTDNNVITANGIAPIEFASEIFKVLELYDEENIEKWFQLFKNGVWSW